LTVKKPELQLSTFIVRAHCKGGPAEIAAKPTH